MKQSDIDKLAIVSDSELEEFARLDSKTQRRIIELTLEPTKNSRLAKADREIAERRARQYEDAAGGTPDS